MAEPERQQKPEERKEEIPGVQKKNKEDEKMMVEIKDLEQAFFALRLYPVAAKEDAKKEAIAKIRKKYSEGEETIRQFILYMIHENISYSAEMRAMHNFDFFKGKLPPATDPGQLRLNVYRAMFNYNTSIEGVIEFFYLLSELGGDDAAKVLTYHFSFLSSNEVDSTRMMKNAIIDALGKINSVYALKALISYAKVSDNEFALGRIAAALGEWDSKIDTLKLSKAEKEKLKTELHYIMTLEGGSSHYR